MLCVEFRGPLSGIYYFLPLCGFQGLDSSHPTGHLVPLLAKLSLAGSEIAPFFFCLLLLYSDKASVQRDGHDVPSSPETQTHGSIRNCA